MLNKYYFLLLSLTIPYFGYAQVLLDIKIEDQPYLHSFYTSANYKGIKKLTYFSDYDINRGNYKDTLLIEYFDKTGDKVKSRSFLYGKKTNEITYHVIPELNVKQSELNEFDSYGRSRVLYIGKTKYNSLNKPTSIESSTLIKGDTTGRTVTKYIYDDKGRLIKREDFLNAKNINNKTYKYEDSNMVKVELDRPGFSYLAYTEYLYDQNHQPIEKKEYQIRDGKTTSTKYSKYAYNDKKLVSETHQDHIDSKTIIQVDYSYDANNRLQNITAKTDTLYAIINYEYKDTCLVKITAKMNAWNKFTGYLYVPNANPSTPMPFIFEREFFYDDKRNLIQNKDTLNGKLQANRVYIIEYY